MNKTSKLINGILHSRYVNYRIIASCDVLLSVLSSLLVLLFTNSFFKLGLPGGHALTVIGLSLVISMLSFWALKTYKGIIRHSGLLESFRLLAGSLCKVLIITFVVHLLDFGLPGNILFIWATSDFFVTFCMLLLFRSGIIFLYRLIDAGTYHSNVLRLVLVYMGDDTTSPLGTEVLEGLSRSYGVVGYLRFGGRTSLRLGRHPLFSIQTGDDFSKLSSSPNGKTWTTNGNAWYVSARNTMSRCCS